MPRRDTHRVVGAIAGVAAGVYFAKNEPLPFAFIETVAAGFGGARGGAIPDELEPADTPNHRGFFHSAVAAALATGAVKKWAPEALALYRANLAELRDDARSESKPWMRALKWLAILVAHIAVGYTTGLAAGYASHLALDGLLTPNSLPLLTSGL